MNIELKGVVFEDFVNYKKPSMYLAFPKCDFKCDRECGRAVCQNSQLANSENISVNIQRLVEKYLKSDIAKAVVCGGLEPLDSFEQLYAFIKYFRVFKDDDIVIYTGYTEEEAKRKIGPLKKYNNIIVKFGRFIPNQPSHYDEVLGVKLASPNQYGKKI